MIPLGPVRVPVPHPGRLHWHDVHHIALGCGHDLVSEAELSAFELRTGVPTVLIALLCAASIAIGVVVSPVGFSLPGVEPPTPAIAMLASTTTSSSHGPCRSSAPIWAWWLLLTVPVRGAPTSTETDASDH